jgi:hypothetical protein
MPLLLAIYNFLAPILVNIEITKFLLWARCIWSSNFN